VPEWSLLSVLIQVGFPFNLRTRISSGTLRAAGQQSDPRTELRLQGSGDEVFPLFGRFGIQQTYLLLLRLLLPAKQSGPERTRTRLDNL